MKLQSFSIDTKNAGIKKNVYIYIYIYHFETLIISKYYKVIINIRMRKLVYNKNLLYFYWSFPLHFFIAPQSLQKPNHQVFKLSIIHMK